MANNKKGAAAPTLIGGAATAPATATGASASAAEAEVADQLAAVHLSGGDAGAEGTDPELWKPHPPTEECPVCLVPLPLEHDQVTYWPCCGQTVCDACEAETDRALCITNRKREAKELPPMDTSCAFCRVPIPENGSELIKRYEERVEKGDLTAMVNLAAKYRDGQDGLARDEAKALELLQRAADLGCPEAIMKLGCFFFDGELGLVKAQEIALVCIEDAAKKGNVISRHLLGCIVEDLQQHDLAIRHFKLAAGAGDEKSTKRLWHYFSLDKLDKAELEATLRAHHAARDEMNSEERERYAAWKEAEAGDDEILKLIYSYYYEGLMTAKELKKALGSWEWRYWPGAGYSFKRSEGVG